MILIQPTVLGPLTPLSKAVVVDKVLPGASVELLVNANPFGPIATATSNSVPVELVGNLTPGASVTARWSLDGSTSLPSLPEVVAGWPSKDLPILKFTSPIHTAMDWVSLTGVYPGATVQVIGPAGPVGPPQTAARSSMYFRLEEVVNPGDILVAVQSVQTAAGSTYSSDKANSMPAESWYPGRQENPPIPAVVGPIAECDGGVHVAGAVPGTALILHTGGDELEFLATGANTYVSLPGQAHAPATFAAQTLFRRLKRQSGLSPLVGVDPTAALTTPHLSISSYACLAQGAVRADDLTPKCEMTLELHYGGTVLDLGRGGTPDKEGTSTDVPMPDISAMIALAPQNSYLILREKQCTLTTASPPAYVTPFRRAIDYKPTIGPAPVACSMWMRVNNIDSGLVVAHSDDPDWPVLSSPTLLPLPGGSTWLHLNRPLRGGENVWAELLAGCAPPNLRRGDPELVESPPSPNEIRVFGTYYPIQNAKVWVVAVIGATVDVYVNDKWRDSQEWQDIYTTFEVGELHREDRITARQTVCGRPGQFSPPEVVRFGQLTLRSEPETLVRGSNTRLTIIAHETLTNTDHYDWPITLNGAEIGLTNRPFLFNVPAATPTPLRFQVAHDGYQTAILDVPVVATPPPPAAELTVVLQVTLGLGAEAITKIDWTLLGAGRLLSKSDTPNADTSTVHIPIPAPTPGPDLYNLSGVAVITYTQPGTGTKITQTVDKFASGAGLIGSLQVEWKGAARTAEINIGVQTNPNTGAPIFYMVLNRLS